MDKVTADLNEAKKLLAAQVSLTENVTLTLRPQTSTASTNEDSGINSTSSTRNVSSSSLPDLKHSNFAPMKEIIEDERRISPIQINVEGVTSETNFARKTFLPDPNTYLNISGPPRKRSTSSATSEEYETPPTSPTISRKISVESSASTSTTPQEVRIGIEIDFPASNEKVSVNTSAMVCKKLKQLQLNFVFTPTSSRHSPAQKSHSASSSTPSSPVPKKKEFFSDEKPPKKKIVNSKSLDNESPPRSPPTSPYLIIKRDKSSRRLRNNLISDIVRKNMVEFIDSTDMESLYPHLYSKELLSRKDVEELQGIKSVRGKKNCFYMLLLGTKGVDAYQKLFECLKNEKEHCGHRDLVKIIQLDL